MKSDESKKQLFILALLFVVCLILLHFLKQIILNEPVLRLEPSSLKNTIALSLQNNSNNTNIGQNFNITSVKYFNNTWVVVKISPVDTSGDNAVAVLKENNGKYQTVISPANEILSSQINSLPTNVVYYLNLLGVVNYSVVNQ